MCSPSSPPTSALPDKSSSVSASSVGQGDEQKTASQIMGRKVIALEKDQTLIDPLTFLSSTKADSHSSKSGSLISPTPSVSELDLTVSSLSSTTVISTPSDFHVSEIPKVINPSEDFIRQHFTDLLSRGNEKVILEFIDFYSHHHSSACNIMLTAIQHRLQLLSFEKFPLVVKILTALLNKMNSQQIILERSTLGEIGKSDPTLKSQISSALQNAHALQLTEFHWQHYQDKDTDKRKLAVLSHPWFVSTPHFLQLLCKQASMDNRASRNLLLLQTALDILLQPQFYPLSSASLFEVNQCCRNIPAQGALGEMKVKLLAATSPTLPINPPAASGEAFTSFQKAVKTAPNQTKLQGFSETSAAIQEGRMPSKEMVEMVAWDLKKIEAHLFCRIAPSEFPVYKSDSHESLSASNIRAYIHHTNILIYFVASHILSFVNLKKRAQCCEFYIQLIRTSLKMGNFNGAYSLLGTLENASISRLKQTWALVDVRALKELEEMRNLFSNTSNFANYHKHVEAWERKKKMDAKHCIIPYFGHFLQRLTFIHEGNVTYLTNGLLNPEKISLFARVHSSIQNYQATIFSLKEKILEEPSSYDLSILLRKEGGKISDSDKLDAALNRLHQNSTRLEPPIEKQNESSSSDKT